MSDLPDQSTALIRRLVVNAGPPCVTHLMSWTRVGDQILLEFGYFDLVAIRQQQAGQTSQGVTLSTAKPEPIKLDWFVTERLILDFDSAERIIDAVEDLKKQLPDFKKERQESAAATKTD